MKLFAKFHLAFSIAIACLLTCASVFAVEGDFPVADSLRPAVNFWKKVYTQADTSSGFLHDSWNLDVVYEKLPRDTTLIEARRKAIISDLNVLAGGKRDGLSQSQRDILNLWGSNTSNQRFKQATDNVRWQLGQSDRYQEGLIRSGAYRAHIEKVALSMGLPIELAALPHVESSFHPGAQSSAAASGMWQFVRETARRFMRVDGLVDERLDPYQATFGAMNLLQENYRELGNWPLALTAYNHGTNGMKRAVRDAGTSDIATIVAEYKGPRFGFASRNFYAQFLAAVEVEKAAEQEFGTLVLDTPPDFVQSELAGFIEADVVARSLGVPLETLRKYNPALSKQVWSGNKRIPGGYTLKVDRSVFSGNLASSLNAIPATAFFTAQIPDVSYVVRSGDSLSGVASRFNTTVSELVAINQLRNRNSIRIGQTLILPQSDGKVPTLIVRQDNKTVQASVGSYTVKRGDTLSTIAARNATTSLELMRLNKMSNGDILRIGQELTLPGQVSPRTGLAMTGLYLVRHGDTLSTIARQFKTTPQLLLSLNKLSDVNLIFPGQELIVRQVAANQ